MTRNELNSYKNIVKKIEYLKNKIHDEKNKKKDIIALKVYGSDSEFPYLSRGYITEAESPEESQKSNERIKKWTKEIKDLQEKREKIEDYIDSIDDYEVRTIFKLKYMECKTQKDIAYELELDQSTISRKIKKQFCA